MFGTLMVLHDEGRPVFTHTYVIKPEKVPAWKARYDEPERGIEWRAMGSTSIMLDFGTTYHWEYWEV